MAEKCHCWLELSVYSKIKKQGHKDMYSIIIRRKLISYQGFPFNLNKEKRFLRPTENPHCMRTVHTEIKYGES